MPAQKTGPHRLKLVHTKNYSYKTKAFLFSRAVSTFISQKLREKLNVESNWHSVRLNIGEVQRARSTGIVQRVLISFVHLHLTMHFYVMGSSPFEAITGVSALETLQGCLESGLQQGTFVSGSKKATVSFE